MNDLPIQISRTTAAVAAGSTSWRRPARLFPLLGTLLTLAGCSLAPPYQPPVVDTPAAFKEAAPAGLWKTAEPADNNPRGEWWKAFADPVLDDLEARAAAANQDLKAGAARLAQARALQQSARSALFPQLGIGAGPSRQRPSPASQGLGTDADTSAFTLWRAQGNPPIFSSGQK
jgi:multidrug efflux system outer membrane protein